MRPESSFPNDLIPLGTIRIVPGAVNVLDLMQLLLAFGTADPDADLTGDGVVDVLDLVELLIAFGT